MDNRRSRLHSRRPVSAVHAILDEPSGGLQGECGSWDGSCCGKRENKLFHCYATP